LPDLFFCGYVVLRKFTFRANHLAKNDKSSTFAPLFGVIAGRKKSYLAMLRWAINNLNIKQNGFD